MLLGVSGILLLTKGNVLGHLFDDFARHAQFILKLANEELETRVLHGHMINRILDGSRGTAYRRRRAAASTGIHIRGRQSIGTSIPKKVALKARENIIGVAQGVGVGSGHPRVLDAD